jgi:hypothetical protein
MLVSRQAAQSSSSCCHDVVSVALGVQGSVEAGKATISAENQRGEGKGSRHVPQNGILNPSTIKKIRAGTSVKTNEE